MIRLLHLLMLTGMLLLPVSGAQAQGTKPALRQGAQPAGTNDSDTTVYRMMIMGKAYGDSIAIRWAPDQATLWRAALRGEGYLLTRRSVGADGKLKVDYQKTIRPWTIDEWKQKAGPRDTLAGLCVQLLYGKKSDVDLTGGITLGKALRQHEQNQLAFALALIQADVNPVHARGLGLGFLDKDVKPGILYRYYIYPLLPPSPPVNNRPTGLPVEAGQTSVVNLPATERAEMIPLQYEAGDRVVRVSWDRAIADNLFTAYYVERSADAGKTFRRLTRRPWLQPPDSKRADRITYIDSTARNYQPYLYRVVGITPFGERSLPATITVRSVDQTPPALVQQVKVKHMGGSKVQVNWVYPNRLGDFKGYQVSKGMKIEGPFVSLTPKLITGNQLTFTDTTAIPYLPAFYRVTAVDTSGNESPSLPVQCSFIDTKGPAKPKGLQGYVDTTGFVRLVWDTSPEADLLGYVVVMANDPDHVFTPRTSNYLAVSVFNDTTSLQTLSRRLCYRVIAYDRNYNPGEPSDILILQRPDRIAPVPPVLTRYVASDSAMTVEWAKSSSTDVREQILLRRSATTERWTEVAKMAPGITRYADLTVKSSTPYTYALVAVDSSGLRSPVSPVLDLKTLPMSVKAAQNVSASLSADGKNIVLNWKHPNALCRYIIYRANSPEPLRSYGAVNRETTFVDRQPRKGKNEYAVKVINPDGRESGLSNRVTIDMK